MRYVIIVKIISREKESKSLRYICELLHHIWWEKLEYYLSANLGQGQMDFSQKLKGKGRKKRREIKYQINGRFIQCKWV